MATDQEFFAPLAWVNNGSAGGVWAHNVLLRVDAQGHWCELSSNSTRGQATALPGAVLPGLVNAHSHAFQRAMAGLAEHSSGSADNFWSWREQMYRVALRISPAQLQAIATQLYCELLQGGYTHVCEFHYLHNAPDGSAYADAAELSFALVRAAQTAGIGLTLLPTLYMRSGFGASGLRPQQQRFASTPEGVLRLAERVNALGLPRINAGVALHSLRAVDAQALAEVAQAARARGWPIHIHIAEQTQEVQDCLHHTGLRPIEWLAQHTPLDARWNLVHATHASLSELRALRAAQASIAICPSTEANLGDGVFDLSTWAALGGSWSIGSDSHVCRSAAEELRWLEYSQRLMLRQRTVSARATGRNSSAQVLFDAALGAGPAACGLAVAGLALAQRADFVVLPLDSPGLLGIPEHHLLDAYLFSSPSAVPTQVYCAGQLQTTLPTTRTNANASASASISTAYQQAMTALWQ